MYNVLQKMLSKCVSEWTFSALPKSEGFVPGRSPGPKYRQQVAREQVARQRTRPRPTSPRGAPGAFGPFATRFAREVAHTLDRRIDRGR